MLISMVNAKFEELSGYSKSDIEAKMSLFQFIDIETKKGFSNTIKNRLRFFSPNMSAELPVTVESSMI